MSPGVTSKGVFPACRAVSKLSSSVWVLEVWRSVEGWTWNVWSQGQSRLPPSSFPDGGGFVLSCLLVFYFLVPALFFDTGWMNLNLRCA